jgi:Tfp pilus assembly protein PilV
MRKKLLPSAFSLVEVTLALGVAAFCLITLLGMVAVGIKTHQASVQQTTANEIISQIAADLRAQTRLPPGQVSKQFGLKGYWAIANEPQYLYFTNEGESTGSAYSAPPSIAPSGAAFMASITYRLPPSDTTSLADVVISWPASQTDLTKVAGAVETFIAVNRQ